MVKASFMVLNLENDTGESRFDLRRCMENRKAPITPDVFEAALEKKGFTNGIVVPTPSNILVYPSGTVAVARSGIVAVTPPVLVLSGKDDKPVVAMLYRVAFEARFGAATELQYSALGWGDEEVCVVVGVLPYAPKLESLFLVGNDIGNEGARVLAEALPSALKLRELTLDASQIGDEGARALAEALPHVPMLEKLTLNDIGDEGARALAKVLRRTSNLKELDLARNHISDDAKKVLRTAWGVREGGMLNLLSYDDDDMCLKARVNPSMS